MATSSVTCIHISEFTTAIPHQSSFISESEFLNGLAIHKILEKHFEFEKNDKQNGIYTIVADNDHLYFGSSNRILGPIKRILHYPLAINHVFKSGDIKCKKSLEWNYPLFEKILSKDKPVQYFMIKNIGYNPKIIEGAAKVAEIVSGRKVFPNLVNRKFEAAVGSPALRYIFKFHLNVSLYIG